MALNIEGVFSYPKTCQHPHQKESEQQNLTGTHEKRKTKPIKKQSDHPKHPSTFRQTSISCIDHPRKPNETIK